MTKLNYRMQVAIHRNEYKILRNAIKAYQVLPSTTNFYQVLPNTTQA